MSTKDYNDGFLGRKRTHNPLSPTGSRSAYAAGQRAAQNAARNRMPTIVWPSAERPKRVRRSPVPAAEPAARPARTSRAFEDVVADLLALGAGGLTFCIGIWVLNLAPIIPFVAACVVGWVTLKLFRGILRPLLVASKYLLKVSLYIAAGIVFLIMLLEGVKK
jgi:hypothetical protein